MCYDAVVFDNDGVLTHPTPRETIHEGVTDAFARLRVQPDEEAIDALIDVDATRIRQVASRFDLDPETLWSQRERSVAAAQRRALEDGTKPLYDDVDTLSTLRATLGIVSNNQQETVESIVELFELGELFPYAAGRRPTLSGFQRRKPNPDYLEEALATIGVESALYVGDSNVDVVAATRAGMDVAFIRRPHRTRYELVAEPTYEVESLEEISSIAY
ncbi:MAG: HAD family hydrolase [Halobacteriota archaeon]